MRRDTKIRDYYERKSTIMKYPEDFVNNIIQGDALEVLKTMPDEFVDCIITSPPYYGLRDYGVEGQLGLEKTLNEYLEKMLAITVELKRVLKPTGTMWWNHGDSYGSGSGAGSRMGTKQGTSRAFTDENLYYKETGKQPVPGYEKSLLLQNFRLAIRMIDEQKWVLRNTIIWHKPNCMPSSVKDRFTVDYEPVFFFTKSKKYWFEPQYEPQVYDIGERKGGNFGKKSLAGREGENILHNPLGRNKRSVWKIPTKPYPEAHFATFPLALIETPIKAGCPEFICKKCGKARETIYKPSEEYKKLLGKSWTPEQDANKSVRMNRGMLGNTKPASVNSDYRKVGYTDCGCNAGWNSGIVLDPFMGSGTTALVARQLGRNYIGIELSGDYIKLAEKRLIQQVLL